MQGGFSVRLAMVATVFLSAALAGAHPGCGAAMTVERAEAVLRSREGLVPDYVRALESLLQAMFFGGPEVERRVMAGVAQGLAGAWANEARWTLQQNPRLHRAFFP